MLRRAINGSTRALLCLALAAPMLALLAAALLDVGQARNSRVRFSIFPLVLTVYDPYTWTSLRNSLSIALAVTAGSMVLGVATGRALWRWRFWGRPVLAAGFALSAVVTPTFLVLGWLGLVDLQGPRGQQGSGDWLRAIGLIGDSWPWIAWVLSALAQGVALVAMATRLVLNRLDPNLEDAARVASADRGRIWWGLTWPMVRPTVAAAAGYVMMITLADPGPPLLLGLRRTLAFQLVVASRSRDPFPRTAVLGLIILVLALAGRAGLRWWGRPAAGPDVTASAPRFHLGRIPRSAIWPRAAIWTIALAVWTVLAWLPAAGLVASCLKDFHAITPGGSSSSPSLSFELARFSEGPGPRFLINSLFIGLAVAIGLNRFGHTYQAVPGLAPDGPPQAVFSVLAGALPALVLGAGMLAFSRAADLGSSSLESVTGWSGACRALAGFCRLLDPCAIPGLLVVLGAVLGCLGPRSLAAAGPVVRRDELARHRVEQAILGGAGRNRARNLGRDRSRLSARNVVLWSTLAATAVSPAILLAPTLEGQPLGAGIVTLAGLPGPGRAQAAALALAAIALNVAALGWARAGSRRIRPPGSTPAFRGFPHEPERGLSVTALDA